jgi:hypothetical protein
MARTPLAPASLIYSVALLDEIALQTRQALKRQRADPGVHRATCWATVNQMSAIIQRSVARKTPTE